MRFNDPSGFLQQFLPRHQSFTDTLFRYAVRGQVQGIEGRTYDVEEVFRRIHAECESRIVGDYSTDMMKDDCEYLVRQLNTSQAETFAKQIIQQEKYK